MNLEWRYFLNSAELGEIELRHNPIGWETAENTLKRSDDWDGVFNNFSKKSLQFVADGYRYLHDLHALRGIAMEVTITVKHWSFINQTYTTEYVGNLNSRTYKESDKNGGSIELNIGEGNFQEKILARADNVVNYVDEKGIDGGQLTAFVKKYEQVMLFGQQKITKSKMFLTPGYFELDQYDAGFKYATLDFVRDESVSNNDQSYATTYLQIKGNDLLKTADGGWIYHTKNRQKSKVILNGFLRIVPTRRDEQYFVSIYIADIVTNVNESADNPDFLKNAVNVYSMWDETGTTFNIRYNHGVTKIKLTDLTFDLQQNQALLFLLESYPTGTNYTVDYVTASINPDYETYDPPSSDESMYIQLDITETPIEDFYPMIPTGQIFQRIIESITGETGKYSSQLLDSLYNLMHANGYMFRGFDPDKYGYSISLNDFFGSLKILLNCGFGIDDNGNAIVERLSQFYQDEVCMTIEIVGKNTFERELLTDKHYASIEVGYDKTVYEENGGMKEYNTKANYSTPISNISNKLTLLPVLRGDGFGISEALYLDVNSTDSQFDDEKFFVDCQLIDLQGGGGIYFNKFYAQRTKQGFEPIEGIDGIDTPMNLDYTPARLAIRNSERFTSGFQYFNNRGLKFNNQESPNNLSTWKEGELKKVTEGVDIDIALLNMPLFSGYKISFNWKLYFADFAYLKANRYKKIKVKNPITKNWHFGWIYEITQNTVNDSTNFVILECANQNDPSVSVVMVDNNLNYVVNDNGQKILVNE